MTSEQEALAAVSVPWYSPEQADSAAAAQAGGGLHALVEATDRHGSVQARLPVTRWPVTIGRDLSADLVLDDPHVAGQHLRLEQHAPGHVRVQVLGTRNGVTLGRRHHGRGDQFDWAPGQSLALGRLHLRLRLAETAVADELPLPLGPWRATLWSITALAVALLLMVGQAWLKSTEAPKLLQELPVLLMGAVAGLALWAGLWALATKLFTGHPQFWRHVRIASLTFVASEIAVLAAQVLAFVFSWESLGQFSYLVMVLAGAYGIYRHLLVVAPQPRRSLAVGVALVVLLGLPVLFGTQWLKNKRLSDQLYMSRLFPPAWRVATPVPVATFMQEAASLEQRLAKRLQDKKEEDAADPASDEE